jgi:hypothetical protein
MLNKKQLPFIVAAALILLVTSFYFGRISGDGKSTVPNFNNGMERDMLRASSKGQNSATRRTVANMISGEIISRDDKSLTIELSDGGSRILYFSDATVVGKTVTTSSSVLAVGQMVTANGETGSDGSLVAQNIQIRDEQSLPIFPDGGPADGSGQGSGRGQVQSLQ